MNQLFVEELLPLILNSKHFNGSWSRKWGASSAKICEEAPDILLTDINMPKMDGITLAQLVRTEYPQMRIIFLTGVWLCRLFIISSENWSRRLYFKASDEIRNRALLVKVVAKTKRRKAPTRTIGISKWRRAFFGNVAFRKVNLRANYRIPIWSARWTCKAIRFSTNYLSLLIKKNLGCPFKSMWLSNGFKELKRLLLSTDMKIYEVALAVG